MRLTVAGQATENEKRDGIGRLDIEKLGRLYEVAETRRLDLFSQLYTVSQAEKPLAASFRLGFRSIVIMHSGTILLSSINYSPQSDNFIMLRKLKWEQHRFTQDYTYLAISNHRPEQHRPGTQPEEGHLIRLRSTRHIWKGNLSWGHVVLLAGKMPAKYIWTLVK